MEHILDGAEIESRLAKLGIVLPEAAAPLANYVPYVIAGELLFVSGQIAKETDGTVVAGCLGRGTEVVEGVAAARLCAAAVLAQAKAALGSLGRIRRLVRLTGYVAAAADFYDHPAVINGASDVMVAALGDRGRHTRVAVGVASLPMGAAVEVDATFEIVPA